MVEKLLKRRRSSHPSASRRTTFWRRFRDARVNSIIALPSTEHFAMTTITIELPDDIAQSARQAGFLSSQTLASVVRELVRERAERKLRDAMNAFDADPVPADQLTPQDIQLAIDAARRH